MKVLNLYAGIGGNRKLWTGCKVTAVERNQKIADIYKSTFPDDQVLVEDAHEYLLRNFDKFDFIWASPPCPTHSQVNHFLHAQGTVRYPDMSLWQEIIFLQYFCKTSYCVENVKSYYEPMFRPQHIERHYFWCNFLISEYRGKQLSVGSFGPTKAGRTDETDVLKRNCVEPELGLHIFDCMNRQKESKDETKYNNQHQQVEMGI